MSPSMSWLSCLWLAFLACVMAVYGAQETIVVFGGNGFVGRAICEEGINRNYRVIAVTRSGCPLQWKSEAWAQKVEWYQADALDMDSYADYLREQSPVAIFTMMGTLAPYKQIAMSAEDIFEYAGTTNINVCNLASQTPSVQHFVYIGADVNNIGVHPTKANQSYALWTNFWVGQYKAKLATEYCVAEKFGDKGIAFRPVMIAGDERVEFMNNVYTFNRFPGYEQFKTYYKQLMPQLISTQELATDALDFIRGGDVNKFHCQAHSKQGGTAAPTGMKKFVLQNTDNIVLAAITLILLFVLRLFFKCVGLQ